MSKIPVFAEILPLDGKYYGTQVKIKYTGVDWTVINLWDNADFVPSDSQV